MCKIYIKLGVDLDSILKSFVTNNWAMMDNTEFFCQILFAIVFLKK